MNLSLECSDGSGWITGIIVRNHHISELRRLRLLRPNGDCVIRLFAMASESDAFWEARPGFEIAFIPGNPVLIDAPGGDDFEVAYRLNGVSRVRSREDGQITDEEADDE